MTDQYAKQFLGKLVASCPINLEVARACEGLRFRAILRDLLYTAVTIQDSSGHHLAQGTIVFGTLQDFDLWFYFVLSPNGGRVIAFDEDVVMAVEGNIITLATSRETGEDRP